MKKRLKHRKISFLAISMIVAFNCRAQRQFTVTSSRENNYCNSSCTLLDNPDLNGNPAAVIFITQVGNQNPHPVCAYYIGKQWSIKNTDGVSMQPGTQFNVEYYSSSDNNHFVQVVTRENLVKKISYIDHPGLNDNPAAQFRFFQNWAPSLRGGNANRNEISIQYDEVVRKWYISNNNNSQLEFPVAYNIILSGNTVVGPVKTIPDIPVKDPKAIAKPGDTLIAINKPVVQKEIVPGKILSKVYDFSNVHICLDKLHQTSLPPRPARVKIPTIKSNGEIDPVSSIGQELSGETVKMWSPGETITVGFFPNETTPAIISKVAIYASAWEHIANIKFQFISDVKKAQIKVGFINDNTSWSWIGREVLYNPTGERTVNFGWLTNKTSEEEFRRVILHELGHVLGFIHEHQAPTAGIPWDKEKVYARFAEPDIGWDKATVDANIFFKYSKSSTNSSVYDPLSIMHYFFEPGLTTNESVFTWNTHFSTIDSQFTKLVYPFPARPPDATGVLHTGDDCDEIEFLVEYDVVDKNVIEFVLEPGRDANNKKITWWKKIAVPVLGNGEVGLEMQDGHFTTKTVAAAIIDKGRGISFGKAKALGVHTGLNFTWNAWPAIIGGCRVKLIWRRDKC